MGRLNIVIVALCVFASEPAMRTWTDASGVFSVQATLDTVDGQTVRLRKQDGKIVSVPLKQLSKADQKYIADREAKPQEGPPAGLGVRLVNVADVPEIDGVEFGGMGAPPVKIGAVLASVLPDGAAAAAKLRPLDIIYRIDRQATKDVASVNAIVASHEIGDRIRLHVQRPILVGLRWQWREMEGWVTLQAKPEEPATPLQLQTAIISSTSLDNPKLILKVKNTQWQSIIAYEYEVTCYNRFDEPVTGLRNSNERRVISQYTIKAHDSHTGTYTFYWQDTTARVKVSLLRVKLEDGTEWRPEEGHQITIWADSIK